MVALGDDVLLDRLAPRTRQWLATIGSRRSYGNGELIHSRGDPTIGMCIVIKGRVRLTRIHADGAQTFVSTFHPGQHFGDALYFARASRTHDARALGEVEIDHYDADAFECVLANLDVMRELYVSSARRLVRTLAAADDLRGLSREAHLAKLLLSLRPRGEGECVVECLQEELAGLLGTSAMTTAKALGNLRNEGLIETGYRRVRIVDPDRLKQWLSAQTPD